jgi:hypothetical protein
MFAVFIAALAGDCNSNNGGDLALQVLDVFIVNSGKRTATTSFRLGKWVRCCKSLGCQQKRLVFHAWATN